MRKEKQLHLDSVKDQINQHGSFVLMSYMKVTANQFTDFRRDVAKTGGSVEVLPKRLLMIAAKESGVELDLNALTGHIGVVFTGEDPLTTAKAVYEFRKGNEENLSVVAGHIDGALLYAEEMEKLSKLPGKQEMRAQLLGVLQAPLSQTVSVMNALVTSVIYCLDNKCKQSQS